jgi:hypothetical protein
VVTGRPHRNVFLHAILRDFFSAGLEQEYHQFMVLNGMLSGASSAEFRHKMDRLAAESDLLILSTMMPRADDVIQQAILFLKRGGSNYDPRG